MWWGKIIGGFFGFMLGRGLIGLIIGVFLGHLFDKGLRDARREQLYSGAFNPSHIQAVFFQTTFTLMGYIAKADGRVSENEIQAALAVMARLGLNEPMRRQAMRLFNEGKDPNFNLDHIISQFYQVCGRKRALLLMFIEIQIEAAYADGHLSTPGRRILMYVCEQLGFTSRDFLQFESMYRAHQRFYDHTQSSEQAYRHTHHTNAHSKHNSLNDAYQVLGVTKTTSDPEIKKAYRRLMSQHHPDKLLARGLPEEMIKHATAKTQKIKAAYDTIKQARK